MIAYSPMAGGFLTGKHSREAPAPGTRFSDQFRARDFYRRTYWHDAHFEAVDRFLEVCKKYDVSAHALGLRWVRSNPTVTACIIGARTEEQLCDNLRQWDADVPEDALTEASMVADWLRDSGPHIY